MIVVLFLLLSVAVGLVIYTHTEPPKPPPPPDPRHAAKAAADLHRIRRRLDASHLKAAQRQDAAKLRREIQEALEGDGEDGR